MTTSAKMLEQCLDLLDDMVQCGYGLEECFNPDAYVIPADIFLRAVRIIEAQMMEDNLDDHTD